MKKFINEQRRNINKMVGVYVYNDNSIPSLHLYDGWPGVPCLPEDFTDKKTLDMLQKAFPGTRGNDMLRLEDHIRHNPDTLLYACFKEDLPGILEKIRLPSANLHIKTGRICRNPNPNLLPPLNGGQWQICVECVYFSKSGHTGRCSKRWVCKWGASNPRKWNILKESVCFHSQCFLIARQFRFESAFLCWTERFKDEVLAEDDPEFFFSERERLLRRDLAAATEYGNIARIRKRCDDLKESFVEFAAKYDVFSRMLNFCEVNSRLVNNVRLLRDEGIVIPEEWRQNLLNLSGEDKDILELHQLLGEMYEQRPQN